MLEPRTRAAFRDDPAAGFLAGASWIYFGVDPSLFGYAIWGRPTVEDVRALVDVLELELDRAPHAVLVDFSGLEVVAPEAFQAIASYAVKHGGKLQQIVTRAAIVRPEGVNGAIVTGFFDVAAKPFPVTFASSVEAALLELGRTGERALAADLAEACAYVSGESSFLRALRVQLAAHLSDPDPAATARELGLSTRTLQRRLGDHETSFALEVQRVRLRTAERLLAETDQPVTNIALDLGFKTSQHFATVFRKHYGHTPTEFRARRR